MRKRSIVILAIVWMVVLVAGVSSAVTMAVCGVFGSGEQTAADVRYQVDAGQYELIRRYERLDQVRSELEKSYYLDLDDERLVLGAVRGMVGAVDDPYTVYYTPDEMLQLNERSQGLYEGVGLLLSADKAGRVRVLRVFRDSPAHEAGVAPGDVLLEVNGEQVSGETSQKLDDAIDRIKKAEGKLVRLTVQRGDEILTLGMARAAIQISQVEYQLLSRDVGYIVLYEFVGDDVSAFKGAMRALQEQGVTKVILDVRSNPGGYLDDVVEIADALMGEGLIVYTEDRYGRRTEYFSDAAMWDVELAVLVNGMSASASEILAGALKDAGRAVVVGEQTYGKGIVQTLMPFREDNAGLKMTTASYYTPSGRSIHGVGVTPQILVELEGGEGTISSTADLEGDSQLRAAYELLMK